MRTHSEPFVEGLPGVEGPARAEGSDPGEPNLAEPTKEEVYAGAERRMRRGKRLVIGGFVVAVAGIVGYCVACFSAAVSPELGSTFLESPGWLVGPALGVIGLGTLLWLVGSFLYLNAAMDSDPNGPDLHF